MKSKPVPKRIELDNPFAWEGDSFYFTSGGHVVRYAHRKWDVVHSFGSRINDVRRSPAGCLYFVGNAGVLHFYRDGTWGKVDLKASVLMSVVGFDDGSVFCGDDAGVLYVVRNGRLEKKLEVTEELSLAGTAPDRLFCGGLGGLYRFDGKKLRKEHDGCIASMRVIDGEIWAGGHQVGLSGRSSVFRRSEKGRWDELTAPEIADNSVFDLVRFRGALFMANGPNGVVADKNDKTTVQGTPPCYRLEVFGNRLVGTSNATEAMVYDGKRWEVISPKPSIRGRSRG